MELRKAEVLGFCAGVRRAVRMIEEELEQGPLETLGAVVHNPHVVADLERRGARVVRSLEEVRSGRLAITAHGVGEEVYHKIEALGLKLIDTTCPIVSRAQRAAASLAKEGYKAIIFGEADHPEVRGLLGWTKGSGVAILDPSVPLKLPRRVALLSQTTKGSELFAQFVGRFLEYHLLELEELRIINTTCPETGRRYEAAKELSRWAEVVLVVGGRNSANTRRLAETCARMGVETHLIEDSSEIEQEWLIARERVGLTAGASTPDSAIAAVIRRLEELAAGWWTAERWIAKNDPLR
ncbi:MAG: 4-hydroxy-3-methylbut-2-enyl diphosphate reductase [Candidatus Bipolaricaulia bacterium]